MRTAALGPAHYRHTLHRVSSSSPSPAAPSPDCPCLASNRPPRTIYPRFNSSPVCGSCEGRTSRQERPRGLHGHLCWPSTGILQSECGPLSLVLPQAVLRDKSPGLAKVPSSQAAHWASPGSSLPISTEALCISPHPHPHHAHRAVSLRVLVSCSGSMDSS